MNNSFRFESKEAERLAQKAHEEFQNKMFLKLVDWSYDNDCIVEARLNLLQSVSDFSFKTTLYLRRMTLDERNNIEIKRKESVK